MSPRSMRRYRVEIRHPEPYLMYGDEIRHAVDCMAGYRRRKG